MTKAEWSVQDAKDKFSALVEAARTGPQTITRHGKRTAVLVSAGEYERLKRIEKKRKPSFAEFLLAMPQGDVEFERTSVEARDVEF